MIPGIKVIFKLHRYRDTSRRSRRAAVQRARSDVQSRAQGRVTGAAQPSGVAGAGTFPIATKRQAHTGAASLSGTVLAQLGVPPGPTPNAFATAQVESQHGEHDPHGCDKEDGIIVAHVITATFRHRTGVRPNVRCPATRLDLTLQHVEWDERRAGRCRRVCCGCGRHLLHGALRRRGGCASSTSGWSGKLDRLLGTLNGPRLRFQRASTSSTAAELPR